MHRGIHELSRRATVAYEEARGKVASWVGATDPSLNVSYRVRARIAASTGDLEAALTDYDRAIGMLDDTDPNAATAGAVV